MMMPRCTRLDYASGKRIIRQDRTDGVIRYINLPEQTINVYGAGR